MKYFEILIMGAISLTDKRDRVYLSLVKGVTRLSSIQSLAPNDQDILPK